MRAQRYDAIVVGSGATGGWAAKELTAAGLRVVVVEAGPAAAPADERAYPYTTARGKPYRWIRSRVLGGRTLSWFGVTLRMSERDLRARDFDGVGDNWPIRYDDLAPFYDRAERWLGVAGARDGLAEIPDGSFIAPRRPTPGERALRATVERRWRGRHVVAQRGLLPGRRWTSPDSTLAAARATGRLVVRTDSIVSHLVFDRRARGARGVACIDRVTGSAFELAAPLVVLCASTIESVRILLASERVRDSDVLGRYLMDHVYLGISGTARVRGRCSPQLGGAYGFYIPRFRNVRPGDKLGFVRGYGVQGSLQRGLPVDRDGVPFQLTAFGEVLADRANRVTLDPARRDVHGLAVPRLSCRYGSNEHAMAADIVDWFGELVEACALEPRATDVMLPVPGSSIHELGGARMGDDRRTSVVDRWNRCWAAPNVLVCDGSAFVSSGCQNPTLTMIALTIRACEYAVAQLRAG